MTSFLIKKEHLKEIGIADEWLDYLNENLTSYEINKIDTVVPEACIRSVAMFLAQTSYESNNYKRLKENMNYKAERLLQTFPKYIKSIEHANSLVAKGKDAIAECVYGNRLDLGNIKSQDGATFIGRGIIQLTGRHNYSLYSRLLNIDLVSNPDVLCNDKNVCVKVACEFFKQKGIIVYAKQGDVRACTLRINGGLHGYPDRETLYKKIVTILKK